jgi:hypothetical protein
MRSDLPKCGNIYAMRMLLKTIHLFIQNTLVEKEVELSKEAKALVYEEDST